MSKCLSCGNTTNFNVWCTLSKVLEVELDENDKVSSVAGEPEEEGLQDEEEYWVLDDDIEFAMVSCAWCGSRNVTTGISDIEGTKKPT